MPTRFSPGPQRGDPVYDQLIRALEGEAADATPPRLTGTTTVGGGNTEDRKAADFRNPMSVYGDLIQGGKGGAPRRVTAATAVGQAPVSYLDGSGNMQVRFQDAPGVGFEVDDILVNASGEVVVSASGYVLLRS